MTEQHEINPDEDKVTLKSRKISLAKSDYKRMHFEEIRELGILHEINRLFLHPLGLALAVMVPISDEAEEECAKDQENLVGLMYMLDDREDPAGTIFAESALDFKKAEKFAEFQHKRHALRRKELGYLIQSMKDSK
jgi:hypothetical protein